MLPHRGCLIVGFSIIIGSDLTAVVIKRYINKIKFKTIVEIQVGSFVFTCKLVSLSLIAWFKNKRLFS